MFSTLKSRWKAHGSKHGRPIEDEIGQGDDGMQTRRGIVTAHFMLGNTYPFTPADWETTLLLGQSVGIDAFALNLGPDEWQYTQLQSAYDVAEQLCSKSNSTFSSEETSINPIPKLFLSLDMNVLPSSSSSDLTSLISKLTKVSHSSSQLRITTTPNISLVENQPGRVVVSTFGGGDASFGGLGWEGFRDGMREEDLDIFFIPAFFLPPLEILGRSYVDGAFAWNAGWPTTKQGLTLDEDRPFLEGAKPYMAAISPWFFTHYGTEPPWGWNKNWIYPSDDNLYVKRWSQILDPSFHTDFVQIISWNDYGESHYIAPILGAQPGSESWTDGMEHDGWFEMTKWFVRRYKGLPNDQKEKVKVYLTYRTQPTAIETEDAVRRPERAEMAHDLIGGLVTFGRNVDTRGWTFQLATGGRTKSFPLQQNDADQQSFTSPFAPGDVSFSIRSGSATILTAKGKPNLKNASTYNYNAWTGYWAV